jgi:hypothetical protein
VKIRRSDKAIHNGSDGLESSSAVPDRLSRVINKHWPAHQRGGAPVDPWERDVGGGTEKGQKDTEGTERGERHTKAGG